VKAFNSSNGFVFLMAPWEHKEAEKYSAVPNISCNGQHKFRWRGCGELLRPAFRKLGKFVGGHPVTTIICLLTTTGVCSLGLLQLKGDFAYDIWFDSSTISYKHYQRVMDVWPDNLVDAEVVLQAIPSNENNQGILAPGCLNEAKNLRDELVKQLPPSICGSADGKCEHSLLSVLEHNNIHENNTLEFLSRLENGTGLPHSLSRVVGGICCIPNITKASALKLRFHALRANSHETADFEAKLVATSLSWRPSAEARRMCPSLQKARCQASNSYKWEQHRVQSENEGYLAIGIVMMLAYVAITLGRAVDCLHSKVLLGSTVILSITFSLAIGMGVGSVFGVRYTQATLLAMFVLLGVGVDDAFIINDAFERSLVSLAPPDRLAVALAEVGPAVLFTSTTDLVAFLVAMQYQIEAIRWFCISAAISIWAVFVCQIFFFSPLLVLNTKRLQSRRCDICPCFVVRGMVEPQGQEADAAGVQPCHPESAAAEKAQHTMCADDVQMSQASQKIGPPWSLKKSATSWIKMAFRFPVMCASMVCFAVLPAFGLFFLVTTTSKGLRFGEFLDSDSYVVDYWEVNNKHFGLQHAVGIFSDPVDLCNFKQLEALQDAVKALDAISLLHNEQSWIDAFMDWQSREGIVPAVQCPLPQHFIESDEGQPFKSDLVPVGDNLVIARAWIWFAVPQELEEQLQLTKRIRATYDAVNSKKGSGFVWSDFFLFADRYENVGAAITTCQFIALGAIGMVCILMLPPCVACASVLSIVLVNVELMGFVGLWGVPMTVPTATIFILSMGFSVDYTAHIAEGLSNKIPCNVHVGEELIEAVVGVLSTTGVSVLHAGISTLIAILMLAFTGTEFFQDIFKCFLLMILFGQIHGLVLLPMLFVAGLKLSRWNVSSAQETCSVDRSMATEGRNSTDHAANVEVAIWQETCT